MRASSSAPRRSSSEEVETFTAGCTRARSSRRSSRCASGSRRSARSELTRLEPKLAGLPPEARARVDEITHLIVEKLLLTPTEQLKAIRDEHAGGDVYADAAQPPVRLEPTSAPQSVGGSRRSPAETRVMTPLRIGTRGSALALWQAHTVATAARGAGASRAELVDHPHRPAIGCRTAPLSEIGGKRLFVKEIEDALLATRSTSRCTARRTCRLCCRTGSRSRRRCRARIRATSLVLPQGRRAETSRRRSRASATRPRSAPAASGAVAQLRRPDSGRRLRADSRQRGHAAAQARRRRVRRARAGRRRAAPARIRETASRRRFRSTTASRRRARASSRSRSGRRRQHPDAAVAVSQRSPRPRSPSLPSGRSSRRSAAAASCRSARSPWSAARRSTCDASSCVAGRHRAAARARPVARPPIPWPSGGGVADGSPRDGAGSILDAVRRVDGPHRQGVTDPAMRVYIVGAGPGDPSLITVRGQRCLDARTSSSTTIACTRVCCGAPASAERIDVGAGRPASRSTRTRSRCLLAEKAREGKTVVRLKWGDPFVFDSGGKEALFLHEQGIPFEVVPGIPAGDRRRCLRGHPDHLSRARRRLTLVRGNEAETDAPAHVDWARVAGIDGTLVCYAGAGQIARDRAGAPLARPPAGRIRRAGLRRHDAGAADDGRHARGHRRPRPARRGRRCSSSARSSACASTCAGSTIVRCSAAASSSRDRASRPSELVDMLEELGAEPSRRRRSASRRRKTRRRSTRPATPPSPSTGSCSPARTASTTSCRGSSPRRDIRDLKGVRHLRGRSGDRPSVERLRHPGRRDAGRVPLRGA